MKGPDRKAWIAAKDLQIEQYKRVKMYKKPVHKSTIERNATILRSIWIYAIKANGRFKARNVTDGKILLRIPKLKERLGDTFSASMSQTEFRLFIALSAYFNYIIWGADATNAFSHAGPPKNRCYMQCDQQYVRWWNERNPNDQITTEYVMEVCHALQGHPESPHLYEEFVNDLLHKRGFRNSKHAPCLYYGKWKGE
jgi:hypothetical protein